MIAEVLHGLSWGMVAMLTWLWLLVLVSVGFVISACRPRPSGSADTPRRNEKRLDEHERRLIALERSALRITPVISGQSSVSVRHDNGFWTRGDAAGQPSPKPQPPSGPFAAAAIPPTQVGPWLKVHTDASADPIGEVNTKTGEHRWFEGSTA